MVMKRLVFLALLVSSLPAIGIAQTSQEVNTDQKVDVTLLRWEDNLQYWEKLHKVLQEEPALEEFRPMYGLLAALGIDVEARDRWFSQAVGASPKMFLRTAGADSLYWLGLRDKGGAYLDGGKTYKLSVPQPVPQKLFWSVTVYDSATRS
jgi:hypothetical protein